MSSYDIPGLSSDVMVPILGILGQYTVGLLFGKAIVLFCCL